MDAVVSMKATKILSDAYLKLRPYDANGKCVDEIAFYASKVLVSAENQLAGRSNRERGSVERLENAK